MKPSDVAHGLELGADDYLSKPFAPLELVARAESKMKITRA
ncbi:response regulator transcription factor [bacterium]|nr:response regulator transcription factor [bacterium]